MGKYKTLFFQMKLLDEHGHTDKRWVLLHLNMYIHVEVGGAHH